MAAIAEHLVTLAVKGEVLQLRLRLVCVGGDHVAGRLHHEGHRIECVKGRLGLLRGTCLARKFLGEGCQALGLLMATVGSLALVR